jgi:hypothetical protein
MRTSLLAAICLGVLTAAGPSFARTPAPQGATPPPVTTPGSWAAQLQELADLVKPADSSCSDHCWVLEGMKLSGALDKGTLAFEVEGELLAKGSYAIPLFGPADKVRIDHVTENGARATVGFEDGHYYVHTASSHFVLRGDLTVPEDRTLTVVGPVNSLDADLRGGRLTEGAHLTAVTNGTVHFDAEGDAPRAQPPVFSIARALRVGKTIDFEYKLSARSGTDLGVMHLPLRYGERVVDVAGSTGWRVESEELLLPTVGKSADVTVTGTLSNVASFSPDPRSPFEWWLLESDAEHRVLATGDAKQHDSSESPIVRREPNSRLFLVQRGQHIDVTVQTLQSMDVLAATVRSHSRFLVLTSAGDLVAQDTLSYDNNGLDYLYFTPDGKPLYLSTDGASERVMHKDGSDDLMVPMRIGQHTMTVQSLGQVSIGSLFGRIALPGPRVPLATGSEDLTLGLPSSVHPVLVTGGDHTQIPFSPGDGVALALSALASALALRGWRKRGLGAAAMFGLWFVSKPVFAAALGAGVLVLVWPLLRRMRKPARIATGAVALLAVVAVGLPMIAMKSESYGPVASRSIVAGLEQDKELAKTKDESALEPKGAEAPAPEQQAATGDMRVGNFATQLAHAGVLDGVRPVQLSMPGYERAAWASRQLVTPTRPFAPSIFYVTDAALAMLALAWLACVGALAWSHRAQLAALRERIREALAAKPEQPAAPVPPAAPEPTAAE